MTENKPIIIDGVPVQDCCYFDYENDGYKDSCYIYQNECSAQNCYFKQLARKQQECEELEDRLKYIRDENIHLKESATGEQLDFLALNNYIKTLEFKLDLRKAEYENWKETARQYAKNEEYYRNQVDQLKAENEELKKKKEENETFYLKKYANKDSACLELEHKLKQAEQKLERIREICKPYTDLPIDEFVKILQIIDEEE